MPQFDPVGLVAQEIPSSIIFRLPPFHLHGLVTTVKCNRATTCF